MHTEVATTVVRSNICTWRFVTHRLLSEYSQYNFLIDILLLRVSWCWPHMPNSTQFRSTNLCRHFSNHVSPTEVFYISICHTFFPWTTSGSLARIQTLVWQAVLVVSVQVYTAMLAYDTFVLRTYHSLYSLYINMKKPAAPVSFDQTLRLRLNFDV